MYIAENVGSYRVHMYVYFDGEFGACQCTVAKYTINDQEAATCNELK